MLALGPVAFLAPWLLTALATLPVLWWLLRVMPPSPRLVPFPAIRLLFGLRETEETPHRTPWWLLLLRLVLAAMIIIALAHPLLNPAAVFWGNGPLVMVVDDGWMSGKGWTARQQAMTRVLDQAEREGKPVMLLTTAAPATGEPLVASKLLRAADVRELVQALQPKPWPVDRAAALAALDGVSLDGSVNTVWLSDGLEETAPADGDSPAYALMERLQAMGSLRVIRSDRTDTAKLLQPPEIDAGALVLSVARADGGVEETVVVSATDEEGRTLARRELQFEIGDTEARSALDLPLELRNRLARLSLDGEPTAGAVMLLDERFRRRPVGLVSGQTADVAQPLLSDLFYLERAFTPFAEVRKGIISQLLQRELAVLVLSDIGTLTEAESTVVEEWIVRGGLLLRFAGPRLAEGEDGLLPVALRRGGRTFGGVMTWSKPARLAPFGDTSPFAGLRLSEEVSVREQVLAEPAPDLGSKVWARLSDGTPLVTATRRGSGWLVLVHTTANTSWSDLALSGLFVEMLQRVVGLSQGVSGSHGAVPLPPLATIDGFGRLGEPPPIAVAIRGDAFDDALPGPKSPPGFYGNEASRRALNLGAVVPAPAPFAAIPAGVVEEQYTGAEQVDLKPWLLIAALALLLADFLIALLLRGLFPGVRTARRAATAALGFALALAVSAPQDAAAQQMTPDAFALEATGETRIAYVITGVPDIDAISRTGLIGLSDVLRRRTSVEAGEPMAVDVEVDELAFFPLLYWPMTAGQQPLTDVALIKLNAYLRDGGTILFDTLDRGVGGNGEGTEALRRLVGGLDLPPLTPIPPDHVLTKAFYLLQEFPGRYTGGTLWVQQPDRRINDGVSPVVVGGNDWAAAWSIDSLGQAQYQVIPGGNRQREMAYRFGINLVMYALTGNYKADQVHVPAILERLGQ